MAAVPRNNDPSAVARLQPPDLGTIRNFVLAILGSLLWALCVFMVQSFRVTRTGQTVGMTWLGIWLAGTSGERVGFGRAVVRRFLVPCLLFAMPYVGIAIAALDLLFMFRADGRCLHDYVAETRVVSPAATR
jgi:uncharacterized RDD family membrane protein YckC